MKTDNAARYDRESKEECLAVAWQSYRDEGHKAQTVRHYYYKMLSAGVLRLHNGDPKSVENAYGYVSRLLTEARNTGAFPWSAVIDPGRRSREYLTDKSLADFIANQEGAAFWSDFWRGQPRRVELWIEKDGLLEFAEDALRRYRIPIFAAKGYTSATVLEQMARRIGDARGKGYTVLYAGDFDPSGLDIERNLRDELRRQHGCRPHITRITLTKQDTLGLPAHSAIEVKGDDTRSHMFRAIYGADQKCYEIEALPAAQLRQMLIDAVLSYIDLDAFNEAMELERIVETETEKLLANAFDGLEDRIAAGLTHQRQALYLVSPAEAQQYRRSRGWW